MTERAGAIVLGVETQIGLALVRELGRAGVPVVAISSNERALGLVSRHVRRAVVAGPPRSERWVEAINQAAAQLGRASLITVSEANLSWVNGVRAQLSPAVHPAMPPQAILQQVLDKSRTLAAARAVGIDTPRTAEPRSWDDWQAMAASFPLPAVLKWSDPNGVAPRLAAQGLELHKAEFVLDRDAMRAAGERYRALGEWPMVQEYCAGHGLGQFFFLRDGQVLRRFQHERVAEWPPEGGFSAVCDSVPLERHAALQEQSIALLRALNWDGVAMVEYRHDPATGRSVLMEINGRFWGSLPLAVACGAGFGLHAHAAALGEAAPALPAPRAGVRCRMVAVEARRLVRVLLRPQLIRDPLFVRRPWQDLARFALDFLRPGVCYFVASWADPRPLLRDLHNMLPRRKGA